MQRVVRPGDVAVRADLGERAHPGPFGCLCGHHHDGGGAIGDRAAQAARGGRLSVLCPKGVPVPALPWTEWSDVGPLLVRAVGIILVSLTDTIATATNFASRRGDEADPDQEMVGIGTSNVAADSSRGLPSPSAVAAQPWLTSLEPGPNWLAWSVQAWSLSCSSFSTGSWPTFLRPPWPLSSSLRLTRKWTLARACGSGRGRRSACCRRSVPGSAGQAAGACPVSSPSVPALGVRMTS